MELAEDDEGKASRTGKNGLDCLVKRCPSISFKDNTTILHGKSPFGSMLSQTSDRGAAWQTL